MTIQCLCAHALAKIEPRPGRSCSPPGQCYHGPAYDEPTTVAHELEAISYRTWRYAGHVGRLAAPGARR